MPQTLQSHANTTSTTQKSTSSIRLAQHDTTTNHHISKHRKTGLKGNPHTHSQHTQPNSANFIYDPNSIPHPTQPASLYNRQQPPSSWGAPSPQRPIPSTNPQTHTARFYILPLESNAQPLTYTTDLPRMFANVAQEFATDTTPYLASTLTWSSNVQTPQSQTTTPSLHLPAPTPLPEGFISMNFPNVPGQSHKYIYGIRRMPTALVTAIAKPPDIIKKWYIHRHQHLQVLIKPFT